jgi:probable HAF family extracellular repeat protein
LYEVSISAYARRMFVIVTGFVLVGAAVPATAGASTATNYQIVDLGSLGGGHGQAEAVNDHGEIVGYSRTTSGFFHAFRWADGRMIDLGTLGGGESYATDINNHGQVVGYNYTGTDGVRPFLWEDGRMIDLGGQSCIANAINDDGQVVGDCGGHPVLWWHGQLTDLTTQGLPPYTTARDINSDGQIVGGFPTGSGFHAYRYQDGQVFDLGTHGEGTSEADAVNDRGEAAGNGDSASGWLQAYFWSGRRVRALGALDGRYSEASGLNDRGQVVGMSTTDNGLRGFVWRHGVITDLGVLAAGGPNGSRAKDVNEDGLIVGSSDVAGNETHPVLWRPTKA